MLMGDGGGLLKGPASSWKLCVVPGEWESGPGETGRKFGSPQRALSTCFLTAGEASTLSRFTRGRKGRAVFFLPFPFSACPSASVGLVSGLPAPSLLPLSLCVSLSVCLSCFHYVPSSPILLKSEPPGIKTIIPGHMILAQPLGPAGQTHFPVCARPARAKWLNLQLMFSSYLTDVAQGLG